jgi:putative endonuclease
VFFCFQNAKILNDIRGTNDKYMVDVLGIGKTGEQVAAEFLKNNGYEILHMNFKNNSGRRLGEIDIIAREKSSGELVFAEVKTREYKNYKDTLPEENITPAKLRKLSRIASFYLYEKKLGAADYRFDAISVWMGENGQPARIKHIKSL